MEISEIVSKVQIYGLRESVAASKYPMAVDTDACSTVITEKTKVLASAAPGTGHDQMLTGIVVQFDLTFSLKAWTEAQRYHFLDFVSSQSTMHRIAKFDLDKQYMPYTDPRMIAIMKEKVADYNADPTPENYLKILYSNPAGFRLTARMTTNYRQFKTIYRQRKTHRLPEWRTFCQWIETLPFAKEFITGNAEEEAT